MCCTTREGLPRMSNGQLAAYAWPGGYPLTYLDAWNEVLCPDCAIQSERNYATEMLDAMCQWCLDPEWDCGTPDTRFLPQAYGVHWEGPPEYCHDCGAEIESAYGEPERHDGSL